MKDDPGSLAAATLIPREENFGLVKLNFIPKHSQKSLKLIVAIIYVIRTCKWAGHLRRGAFGKFDIR